MFVPVVMTNLSVLFCIYTGQGVLDSAMKLRITGDVLVSVITLFACMTFSTRMTLKPLASLEKSLGIFSSGHGTFSERLPTDLSDDFAFVVWLMNRAIGSFQEILSKLKAASQNLNNSIQELNVSTQEISATSNQQAAGVKEIISTMEDSDQLSKRVASQANEVAKIAEGTKDVVATGFVIIKESLEKMESIKDANELSIRGIRELGDKIERIWDIVNIINGIADQTKIIAFNAELEAASAGEAFR
jgi:methyl-accepting chemotaxis protein